jgi:hypothetical protein
LMGLDGIGAAPDVKAIPVVLHSNQ